MPNDHDVRIDIRDRLLATDLFAEVSLAGPPEQYGIGASDASAAFIEPLSGKEKSRWDGGDDTLLDDGEKCGLTLMCRDQDPELRDRTGSTLLAAAKDAINGRSLAGLTVPDLTLIEQWQWLPPRAPERRIRTTVAYQYLAGWRDNDDTEG